MISSKSQEQEVLNKIVDLLDSLEKDSYVRTAFEGCCLDAQINIDNDFSLSYYDRYVTATKLICELKTKINYLELSLKSAHNIIDEKERLLNHALAQLNINEDEQICYGKNFIEEMHDKLTEFCEWADSVTHLL